MTFNTRKTPDKFNMNATRNHATGIYIGIVKEVVDRTQFMGRLKVWIPEFGGNPKDPKSLYIVSYASPFAGATPVTDNEPNANGKTQQSYGFWMVPPDNENQVLVCFVNGDTARGYWFACLYQQAMNYMVPAIANGTTIEGENAPVFEYNKRDPDIGTSLNTPQSIKRKRFAPLADGLQLQGLDKDTRKGSSTTSARRESPSRVFGFITPRGNSVHIDDGVVSGDGTLENPDNEFIRLRTRSGVGITIHETDGFVFITSKNGKSYLELSDHGINAFTEKSLNLRTTSDYNIQSSGDINIDAGGNLNIYATGHIAMGSGEETYVAAGSDLVMGSGGNSSINADGDLLLTSGGITGLKATGNSLRTGATIIDGGATPSAPKPISPERHPMPDGSGGTSTGSSIGSHMPHKQSYHPAIEGVPPVETGTADIPKSVQDRAKILYALLKKKGYSEVQIAAILGTWMQESTLSSTIINSIGATGLSQWLGSRRANLLAYARSTNQPWDNYSTQVDFFEKEMTGVEKKAGSALRSATTLSSAMAAMNSYERFGSSETGKRYQYMNTFMAQISSSPNKLA